MKNVEIGLLSVRYRVEEVDSLLVVIREVGLKKEVSIKARKEVIRTVTSDGDLEIGYECEIVEGDMTGEALYHPNLESYLVVKEGKDKVIESGAIEFTINSMTGYRLDLEVIDESDFVRISEQFNRVR